VNGTNFVTGSVVDWNGSARTTTFVSLTQLTAIIQAPDIASAGTASITVSNSGVSSAAASFTISASTLSTPTLTSLSPAGATAGTVAFPLIITGSNFLPCSSVQWVDTSNNLTQLTTTYVSPTQLSAVGDGCESHRGRNGKRRSFQSCRKRKHIQRNLIPNCPSNHHVAFGVLDNVEFNTGLQPRRHHADCERRQLCAEWIVVNWNGSPAPDNFCERYSAHRRDLGHGHSFPGTCNCYRVEHNDSIFGFCVLALYDCAFHDAASRACYCDALAIQHACRIRCIHAGRGRQ